MKKQIVGLGLASMFIVGFGRPAAATEVAVVDSAVSFDFTVGHTRLPAGRYEVLASDEPSDSVLFFRNRDTGKTTLVEYVTRLAPTRHGDNELVFDEIGGTNALREIRTAASDGYLLPLATNARTHGER